MTPEEEAARHDGILPGARQEDLPEWRAARAVWVGNTEIAHGNHEERFQRAIQATCWMQMIGSAEDPEELAYARAYVAHKIAKLPRWVFCRVIERLPAHAMPPPSTRVQATGAVHIGRAVEGKAGVAACGRRIGEQHEPTWLPESTTVTCGHCQ